MSAPHFYKDEDITEGLIDALKETKDSIDGFVPKLRDSTSSNIQALAHLLETQKKLVNSMDTVLERVGSLPCSKKVFMDFVKVRDLEKEFVSSMKTKLEMDKRFLEILEKFLFTSTQL